MKGIIRQYSVARTPQQHGLAKRRNRTLIEADWIMLADSKLPNTFWTEAVNTACFVQNRVLVTKPHNKTPYELFHGRTPMLSFMRPFGYPVTILNTIDQLGKFDRKADEGFFVGYSLNSKAFRVFNSRTRIVEETLHIRFSENTPNIAGSTKDNNHASQAIKEKEPGKDYILLPLWTADPPFPQEPKKNISIFEDSNEDDFDIEADLNNLESTFQVSPILITRIHKDHPFEQVIGDLHSAPQIRRMSKNLEEHGLVGTINQRTYHKDLQNCLFACFLSQMEPEKDFMVYQMDVKSAFLYGKIEEEDNGFQREKIDKTLFIKRHKGDILLVQVYVDDIFFGSTKKELCTYFEKLMHGKFQMSSIEELTFFLGLQCKKQTVVANSTTEAEYVAASSCCGQFWTTAKSKTINEEVEIHALLDGMKVIITESSVRRDLQLTYEDGDGPKRQDTMGDTSAHTRYERVSKMSSDSLLAGVNTPRSDEDSLKHIELMKIYTTLQKKVLDLDDELKRKNTAQQTKIDGLEKRVKKLEKKHMSRTHKLMRLYKVGLTARVISSSDDEALDKDDTSKQGRIDEIDADEDITLVYTHDDVAQDEGIEDVGEEEVVEVVTTAKMLIDTAVDAAQVTTAIADILVSAAETIVTTAPTITAESTKTNVEVTQAPKRKGVMIQEPKETTTRRTTSS
nr:ribonuclease H-like domain-containing protein [Tanacetum cinerariifolium]